MQPTGDHDTTSEYITAYTRIKLRSDLSLFIGFLMIFIIAAGDAFESSVIKVIGFFGILGCILFGWYNWRCPRCRQSFARTRSPKYCSECGVQLQ